MTRDDPTPSDAPLTPLSHAILLALADGDLHGYNIVQEVESLSGGTLRTGTGTLYAALQRMAGDGLIADSDTLPGPDEDQRRKYYRITEAGRAAARAEAARLQRVLAIAARKDLLPGTSR